MGAKTNSKKKVETMTNYAPKPQPKKQNNMKLLVGKPIVKETKKGYNIIIPVTEK